MTPEVHVHVIDFFRATPLRFDPPLDSPEYKAQLRKLLGEPATPPRPDWPMDLTARIEMHRAIASKAVEYAAHHAKMAIELAGEVPQ